jgi:hypothetical protein
MDRAEGVAPFFVLVAEASCAMHSLVSESRVKADVIAFERVHDPMALILSAPPSG